jgi:hypothetical protein
VHDELAGPDCVSVQLEGVKTPCGSLVLKPTKPVGGGGFVEFTAVTVAVQVPAAPIAVTVQLTVVVVESVAVMIVLSPLGALFASPG